MELTKKDYDRQKEAFLIMIGVISFIFLIIGSIFVFTLISVTNDLRECRNNCTGQPIIKNNNVILKLNVSLAEGVINEELP